MKRSDALEKIQEVINKGGGPEAILDALIYQIGMLPPRMKISIERNHTTLVNTWEANYEKT